MQLPTALSSVSLRRPTPLEAGGVLSAGVVTALVLYWRSLMRRRVGERVLTARGAHTLRPQPGAEDADDEDATLWRQNQMTSGVLDRWYQAQPHNEKRHFVEALRLRGPVPSKYELECALTKLAAKHPRILMLPHPSEWRIHSQLPAIVKAEKDAGAPKGTLPFPLPLLAEWVAPPVEWVAAPGSPEALKQLQSLIEHMMNDPVANDPPAEACASGSTVSTPWRSVHIQLVRSGEGSSGEEGEFALVVHLAHNLCDGLSGLVFLRLLLGELAALRQAAAAGAAAPPTAPTRIALSEFRPLCEYPSMDDLVDVRPTRWRMLQLSLGERRGKLLKWGGPRLGRFLATYLIPPAVLPPLNPPGWWDGNAAAGSMAVGEWGSRCSWIRVPPESLANLAAQARRQGGNTIQAALFVASTFATGVVAATSASASEDKGASAGPTHILTGSSVSFRRFCQASPLQLVGGSSTMSSLPGLNDLLGNIVGLYTEAITLDPRPSSLWAALLGGGGKQQRAFSVGRGYLRRLHDSFPFVMGTLGLLGLFNARYVVRGQGMGLRNQRSSSVVVSNLGMVGGSDAASPLLPSSALESQGFQLLDAFFAQTAKYVHPVFFNSAVASVHGGLNVAVTSPTRVVSDEQVRLYIDTFLYVIERMAQGDNIDFTAVYQHMQTHADRAL